MESGLIIKIKVPAAMELHFDCHLCGKRFSNEKALCGHQKAHAQKEKNIEGEVLNCPICNKSFNSKKSVHGHMRKHPDRTWRGMKLPTHAKNGNSDEGDNQLSHDLLSNGQGDNQLSPDLLSKGQGDNQLSPHLLSNGQGDNQLSPHLLSTGTGSTDAESFQLQKKRKLIGCSSSKPNINPGQVLNPIKSKGPLYKNNPMRAQKAFVCTICNRDFKSLQALDGHRDILSTDHSGSCSGAPAEVPGGGEEESRKRSPVFEFDLNEFPPEWPAGDC